MITLQYAISVLLISSALIARNQFLFLSETNLGMTKSQIIAIPGVPDEVKNGFETFKKQVSTLPGVLEIASCMEVPSREIRDSGPVLVKGKNMDKEQAPVMDVQIIDLKYIDLLEINIREGSNLPVSMSNFEIPAIDENYSWFDYLAERPRAYLINETAMRQLGWQDPEDALGQEINWSISNIELSFGPIVGSGRKSTGQSATLSFPSGPLLES
jgi:putative ABC transport system permease protein